ncbi:inositol monophosphatase family protein [Streptomyces liangshanensis]|uniref:Inositol monophosphatase n=1 Tax=Streptomyces liangshanensis TaxID=2717324 RepID=A0A6G9GSG8_9ACTN|nr:inositol monophosphatase [Streptomyces liangshanensis]QIQ01192.1 inositol monophosphatase [Streptomyces liangshanensis]
MSDHDLLRTMTTAARTVGRLVAATPVRTPAATSWAEFRERFEPLDQDATALFKDQLAGLRPDAVWAGELGAHTPGTGEVWVADPVDGAVQFLQDMPYWSVSLTLVRDRRPVATVLHAPLRGETVTALAGHGAFRDGVPLRPSLKTDLTLALLGTSQPPLVASQPSAVREAGRSLSAVLPHVGAVRNLGPTSWQVADTAAGRLDAFWEYGTDDTNLVGGALVAAEAGLRVTDLGGRPWSIGATSFLAAPAQLHGRLLDLLEAPAG